MHRRRAIFIDKDGTLIEDVPYNVAPERIALALGADRALPRLAREGFGLVVVSNQSGVARGYFQIEALRSVERRLRELLAEVGVCLAGFYWCPHHPEGQVKEYAIDCHCRKPRPGLLLRAARELHLDLSTSWMIGDILDDVEAAHAAGCRAVLLDNGGETQWRQSDARVPEGIAGDLVGAVDLILREGQRTCLTETLEGASR
jgi:histidinol-phosphate phosphatase family protein